MNRRLLVVVAIGLALLAGVWWVWRGRGGGDADGSGDEAEATVVIAGSALRATRPDPMTQPRARIRGTVRDDKGAGVAGATVCASGRSAELAGEEDRDPHCAPSAAGGAYLIGDLPPASYSVAASAPRFAPAGWTGPDDQQDFRLGAGEERTGIDLVLRAGGVAVRGVVNDIGGGPIAEAWVTVDGESSRRAFATARSDAEGKFTVWVSPGPIWAGAQAEGYALGQKRWTAPSDKLEILLTPESVLAGRVVEAGSDRPVAGAMVEASYWDGGDSGQGSARSDADGRFRITRLLPGRYKPTATGDGRWGEAKASVLLGLGQTVEDVVIEVHPAFMVAGRVVIEDSGATRPCEQGSVSLQDRSRDHGDRVDIGAGGEVRVRALFPGSYEVRVNCDDHLAADSYPPVVVADADVTDLTWTVTAGGSLLVQVVRAGGDPVAGAYVQLEPRKADRRVRRWRNAESTDGAGQARLRGLLPGGYDLQVDTADAVDPEPRQIEVTAGESRIDVTVAAGGSIRGVVVDVAGRPVPGATVQTRGARRGGWRDRALTGDDGSFRLDGLPPGDTRVVASRGWRQELRRPDAGDDEVQGERVTVIDGKVAEVRLVVESQSERITGTVTDAGGAPVTDAFVAAARESEAAGTSRAWARRGLRWGWDRQAVAVDAEGAFTIGQLSPGSYTVRAYRRGGGEGIAEGVRAGGSVRLVIRPTGSLSGRVALAGGGAPERFTISLEDDKSGFEREESFFRTGGAFTLADLPAGVFKVAATAAEGTAFTDLALAEGEQRTGLALALEGRVTLTGRMVELGTGKPVEGMRVFVRPVGGAGGSFGGWDDPTRVSGADGRVTVERAPRGRLEVFAVPVARESSPYSTSPKLVTVPADATRFDVGDIEVLRRRLPPRERPGDLGFELVEGEPGQDPDAVKLEVARVRAGGPADGSGLVAGDVIVAVDDVDVRGASSMRYWTLAQVPAGTAVRFTLARGATVTITAGKPL